MNNQYFNANQPHFQNFNPMQEFDQSKSNFHIQSDQISYNSNFLEQRGSVDATQCGVTLDNNFPIWMFYSFPIITFFNSNLVPDYFELHECPPITTPEDDRTPPVDLRVIDQSPTSISLAWKLVDKSLEVISYEVFRDGVKIADLPKDILTYTDTGLTPGTTYTYSVQAHVIDYHSNIVTGLTTTITPSAMHHPEPPTNLRVTKQTQTSITLTWDAPLYTLSRASYIIIRNGEKIADVTKLTYTDTDLKPATTYTYTVRTQISSEDSNIATGVTFKPVKKNVKPAKTSTDTKADIRIGSRVRVNQNAKKWATGENIAPFVLGQVYRVQQMRNNNKELLLSNVMSWIKRRDVTIV